MIPNHVSTYADLGFKTLPITYGKKSSPPPEWTHTPSQELWKDAPSRCNTGLQSGPNGMFLLDPDTEHGAEVVKNYLDMKGINAWKVTTWRNFTHYWVKTLPPEGTQWNGKLQNHMGDWRAKNGYGLAAPSFVRMGSHHGFYTLPDNNPGTVPFVEWEDLLPLLKLSTNVKVDLDKLEIPVPTVRRKIPRWVYSVVEEVNQMRDTGTVSVGARHWSSRSEAVMSSLMSAMLNGYSLREVMNWFDDYKYDSWWQRSAAKAVAWMSAEAERPVLENMYHSSYDLPTKDEKVLRGMVSVLWYVGSSTGCVANRDIQMLVARGRYSVSGSVKRLINSGIVELVEKSDGTKASKYRIDTNTPRTSREESVLSGVHQEAFRYGGISNSQRKVLDDLRTNKTPAEIREGTGLSSSGVYAALRKLQERDLVVKVGNKWSLTNFTIDQVNATMDTGDSFLKRKTRISTERGMFHNRG